MNALTPLETKNEIAPVSLSDPFAQYADAVAPRYIVGDLLRFSKGDYLAGQSSQVVEPGSVFTANLDELMAGWIKWVDGKPAEHLMVRVANGVAPPRRAELGDLDQSQWEKDASGQERDPWQFCNYLPLMNEKGELFTFTTSSRGGINAIAMLARRYANHRKRHPDVFPLIALGVDSYQHSNREFGRIKFPVFAPTGYAPKTQFLAALAAAGIAAEPAPVEAQPGNEPGDQFADEIPF